MQINYILLSIACFITLNLAFTAKAEQQTSLPEYTKFNTPDNADAISNARWAKILTWDSALGSHAFDFPLYGLNLNFSRNVFFKYFLKIFNI